jgi:hypothetical protein
MVTEGFRNTDSPVTVPVSIMFCELSSAPSAGEVIFTTGVDLGRLPFWPVKLKSSIASNAMSAT